MVNETFPIFPGGEQKLVEFIQENVVYPQEAKEKKIKGKVIVRFVVSKTGEITDVQVRKSPHPLLEEEAVRVVKSMPKWVPGTRDGKPVDANMTLPIDFILTNGKKTKRKSE